jgi:hypothetical protein
MKTLVALLMLFTPVQDADCGPDGRREMRELYRETEKLIDRIEQERGENRGKWTDEAIELRAELREKEDQLIEWVAKCQPIVRRRKGVGGTCHD